MKSKRQKQMEALERSEDSLIIWEFVARHNRIPDGMPLSSKDKHKLDSRQMMLVQLAGVKIRHHAQQIERLKGRIYYGL